MDVVYEILYALIVMISSTCHACLLQSMNADNTRYGSIQHLTSEFGLHISSRWLILLDIFTIGYNSNYATSSYFIFIFACRQFLRCSHKLSVIAESALDAGSGHRHRQDAAGQQLMRTMERVRLYMQIKRTLQNTLGFLVFTFLASMFLATTSIVIVICEILDYRTYRSGFGLYYLFAFLVPLVISVCIVDQCEHLHVHSYRTLHRYLLHLLSRQSRSEGAYSRRLMAAFNLLHYGMQQTCLTAWHLLAINRRLPLKYFSLNISFIVMVYNLVKPSLNLLDESTSQ